MTAMVRIYCRAHHKVDTPCGECDGLVAYAAARLDKCPFQVSKPTCAKCSVHCYRPEMRERARAVMRFSGPRMLVHHPFMAVRHMVDGIRSPKAKRTQKT